MNKAVFIDRDGVINKMLLNKKTNEYQPPFNKDELEIYDGVIDSLKELQENNFKLFLISNQPDYAKGKTSLENLSEVHNELHNILIKNNVSFSEYYYCYHHPEGIIKEFSYDCECRKPKNYFVIKAVIDFYINKEDSWFIGDRDKDIECGRRSGLKTIRILSNYYEYKDREDADYIAADLTEAAKIILTNKNN